MTRLRILIFLLCLPTILHGQDPVPADSLSGLEIGEITFEGNRFLSDGTLREALRSRESPSGFSQFMHGTFWGAFGSPAEIFDPVTFTNDLDILSNVYETKGFYGSQISQDYTPDPDAGTIRLHFTVTEGPRSYIDTVVYTGLDSVSGQLRAWIYSGMMVKTGDPYESDVIPLEINRVVSLLQNKGYPFARINYESSGATRFTSSNNFEVTLDFEPGNLYTFGDIRVMVDPPRDDITRNLTVRHLDFSKGDLYSRELSITSERNLNRLDLFEAARVEQDPAPDTVAVSEIPMRVLVKPQPRNELSPELIVSDENGALNLGLGVAYTNRNFLGDGRIFNARVQGRSQSIVGILKGTPLRDSAIIGSADLEFRVTQPYLFSRRMSGFWTSSIGVEKQTLYLLSIVRNRMGSSIQLSRTAIGLVEWTLERVKPEILVVTDQPDTVLSRLRTEEKPQFNSIISFTWQREQTDGLLSPSQGFIHTFSVEESGVLPKLLPGIRSGLPFTQYYKASLLSRWYMDLGGRKFSIFAVKFRTGYQDKYGGSRLSSVNIPLNRRFFSGGSNSVRGWRSRKLGAMPVELLEFGGNFVIEGSAELRVNHFYGKGKFLGMNLSSIWGVYFVDVGNVYANLRDFRPSSLAIAAGLGFRYETLFGPFRVDFGVRLYDPGEQRGRRSVFDKKFLSETLGSGVFHLGLGHAF